MKITRKQLRQIIHETIRENNLADGSEGFTDEQIAHQKAADEHIASLTNTTSDYKFPQAVVDAVITAFDATQIRTTLLVPPGQIEKNAEGVLHSLRSSGYSVVKK